MPEYESSRDRRAAKGLLPGKYLARGANSHLASAQKNNFSIPEDYNEGIGLLRPIEGPVMNAIHEWDTEALEKLVKSGADLNQRDSYGYTPAMFAVTRRNLVALKMLLDNGADPNAKSTAGNTGLSLAAGMKNPAGQVARNPSYSYIDAVLCLLNAGADKNTRIGENGATVLIVAIQHGRLDIVAELIKRGADVNMRTEDGSTALHYAILAGDPIGIDLLLRSPIIDVSIKDNIGMGALELADRLGLVSTAKRIRNMPKNSAGDAAEKHKKRMEENNKALRRIDEEMERISRRKRAKT